MYCKASRLVGLLFARNYLGEKSNENEIGEGVANTVEKINE
jgi:hypothetical protein